MQKLLKSTNETLTQKLAVIVNLIKRINQKSSEFTAAVM